MISGIFPPTRGQTIFLGKDITRLKPNKRAALGIARTFQVTTLFDEMSVIQNVILGGHGKSGAGLWEIMLNTGSARAKLAENRKNSEKILEFMGLTQHQNELAKNLPHGFQMRLELATHDIVKMGIGLVPEGRKLFFNMSVLENILMGAYLQNDKQKTKAELSRVYEYFPVLKKRQKQRAGNLSGGEQQMLAIGRALMSKPSLLVLDEPSTGLAPLIIQHLGRIIQTINQEGVSMLIVEQNAKIALKLAQKGYVLETGAIVLKGETEMLLQNEAVKKAYLGS